jgi:hypothetical protein
MENITHYIGVTLALGVLIWGMIGFYRGLSMPRNEHRPSGKGDNWLT